MNPPSSVSLDILRIYDKAMMDFVKNSVAPIVTGLDTDVRDNVVFSTPERPYGMGNSPQARTSATETKEVSGVPGEYSYDKLKSRNTTKEDVERATQTVYTPMVSVMRTSMNFAWERNNNVPVRVIRYWDADKTFAVGTNKAVRPWDIHYQLEFHGRFRDDLNKLIRFYMYNPDSYYSMWIDFKYPWGKRSISCQFGQVQDLSQLETEERERWIRYMVPITVEGFLFEAYEDPSHIVSDSAPDFIPTRKVRTAKQVVVDYTVQNARGEPQIQETDVQAAADITNTLTVERELNINNELAKIKGWVLLIGDKNDSNTQYTIPHVIRVDDNGIPQLASLVQGVAPLSFTSDPAPGPGFWTISGAGFAQKIILGYPPSSGDYLAFASVLIV